MTRTRSRMKDLSIAYHEAGHVVAHWVEEWPIVCVTIEPCDDAAGYVQGYHRISRLRENPGDHLTVAARKLLEAQCRISAAGVIAQQKFNKRGYRRYQDSSDRYTWQDAVACIARSPVDGEVYLAYQNLLWVQAVSTVEALWPAVGDLATQLVEHRTFKGKDAFEIVRKSMADRNLLIFKWWP